MHKNMPKELPLVSLNKTIVFPQAIVSLYISEKKTKAAVMQAWDSHRLIFTSVLKESKTDEVYEMGVCSLIMRMKKMEDGRIKILVQGLHRASVKSLSSADYIKVQVNHHKNEESAKLNKAAQTSFDEIKKILSELNEKKSFFSPDFLLVIGGIQKPCQMCDLILSNLNSKITELQKGLEAEDLETRLDVTKKLLKSEIDISLLQNRIKNLIKTHSHQKPLKANNFSYSTQPNSAKKEDVSEYMKKIQDSKLPEKIEREAIKQVERLEKMHNESSEASMIRSHLDWITDLPWNVMSEDMLDIKRAEKILNKDHYGLEKVKERILEFLAVKTLNPKKLKAPILCFSGPPGVGKTSLGQSIATSMNRKFFRIALGGVKDEAEIRGHRRTYVGAMPGKIIQALKHVGTKNPVVVLDEVDKLGADFRGDPSSALLEVLDPEQNHSFKDHYLNIDFDLSNVLFIATANLIQKIPPALKDRLEVISISGYSQEEKVNIVKNHLIEKELEHHGLPEKHISFSDKGLKTLINSYTQEAGLRNLKRTLSSICRKVAKNLVLGDKSSRFLDKKDVIDLLGAPDFLPDELIKESRVGLATGLAWTEAGGQILHVEAITVKNKKGGLILTGKLGEVMKESAQAALSYVKSFSEKLNIDLAWFENNEIHIHLPQGAIPKDGPSAGVTIASVLISLVTKIPINNRVAMTGEISLSGRVLPVGGIKEKVLAALNRGITSIIIPKANEKDLEEIPEKLKKKVSFTLAKDLTDVFNEALILPLAKVNKSEKVKDQSFSTMPVARD